MPTSRQHSLQVNAPQSTVQYGTVLYSAVQCSTVQYKAGVDIMGGLVPPQPPPPLMTK